MKISVTTSIAIIFSCLILSACSATGPAEDSWDEELKDARFIFSEKLQSDIDEQEKLDAARKSAQPNSAYTYTAAPYGGPPLSIDEKSFKEFEEFKAWRRAKQSGSIDFQEYQDWQAYQQYRRFKSQEKSTEK